MKSFKLKALIMLSACLMVCFFPCHGQNEIQINAIKPLREVKSGHLKMGNPGPSGKEIIINQAVKYILKNQLPWRILEEQISQI